MESIEALIARHPFLRTMRPEHVAVLAEGAHRAEFEAGQLIFREREIAYHCYLIQSGVVALESHVPGSGDVIIQTLGKDEALGWSWLFAPYLLHFQARALERTGALCLNGAHLLVACEKDHDFGYELMKRVSQLLITRMQATRRQLMALHQHQESSNRPARAPRKRN